MGDKTKISWADATWNMIRARNTVTGKTGWYCQKVTAACDLCYAEKLNMKAGDTGGTGLAYKPGHLKDVEIFLSENALMMPLRWRRGRRIFPCSMTDLFGAWVPDAWIDKVFAVMTLAHQHTFEVLTKRPRRMRLYLSDPKTQGRILEAMRVLAESMPKGAGKRTSLGDIARWDAYATTRNVTEFGEQWPPRNIWVGTSICDQANAEDFVPELLSTPAALHFVSAAPLLGPINLRHLAVKGGGWYDALMGECPIDMRAPPAAIGWVLTEGESGREARPTHPDWFRRLRDDCAATGVPFHHKQNGEWLGGPITSDDTFDGGARVDTPRGQAAISVARPFGDGFAAVRWGLKTCGRELDGKVHDEFPA